MKVDEFWEMTWNEYEYAVEAYRIRIAQLWEPTRYLSTFIHNMFAEKKIKPQELFALYTDAVDTTDSGEMKETDKDFFQRMVANNFYQSPKE